MRVAVDLTAIRQLQTGVERVAMASFRALTAHRNDFEWLGIARPQIARQIEGTEARVVTVRALTRAGRVLWQQACLPFLLRRHRADALWSPAYTAPISCSCPVVLLVHDTITLEHPELCTLHNKIHFGALLGAGVRNAWRTVVPSRAVAETVARGLRPRAEPVVVPPGLAASFLSEPSREDLDNTRQTLQLPDRFVLAVGRLEPKKNLTTVVRALGCVSGSAFSDLGLVIVGAPGPDSKRVFRTIRESPRRDRIRYLRQVKEEELASLYRLADCLVFPSFAEGFGIPPMESLALGTPALVSRHTPSYVERWGVDGWVFPSLEPQAVAGTITRILSSEKEKADVAAKSRLARELTWENHTRSLLEIMRSLPGC